MQHPTDRDRMMAHADDDEARKLEARERVERQCPPNTCKACGREAVTWDGKCVPCWNAENDEFNEGVMTELTKVLDMTIGPVAAKADHIADDPRDVSPRDPGDECDDWVGDAR